MLTVSNVVGLGRRKPWQGCVQREHVFNCNGCAVQMAEYVFFSAASAGEGEVMQFYMLNFPFGDWMSWKLNRM